MQETKRDRGFTLIELIVVLAILSISILTVPAWFKSLTKVKVKETASLFAVFLNRLEFETMNDDKDMLIVVGSNCTLEAFGDGVVFTKFKKPSDVQCKVYGPSGEEKKTIFISQGYVEPVKIVFYKGKTSRTINTLRTFQWK